ncbi:MAG TPA: hypothetical protein VFQ80_01125, partial [Thermomicrobiales bacterium]|nr:hypothetical protein [Thermomicrobiales bacterium]
MSEAEFDSNKAAPAPRPMAALPEITPFVGLGPELDAAAAALVARVAPSVVIIGVRGGGGGAGVIWRPEGIVVTNRHVVKDDRVDVTLAGGHRYTGIVAARHPD